MSNEKESLSKLKEMIGEVQIAMLCSKHNNHLNARPMATTSIDDEGNIWFYTNEFSCQAIEVANDPEVCLAYSSPSKNTYISIVGRAELIDDRLKMEQLWNPMIKAWFPKGLEDPKISLLKVTPIQAEYWDSSSNAMVTFFNAVKAAVLGQQFSEGEHGKIEI